MATSYNAFEVQFLNQTDETLTVQGAFPTSGQWIQGEEPSPGTQCPANAQAGPWGAESFAKNEGNGAYIALQGSGGHTATIVWSMPWNGVATYEISSQDYVALNSKIQPAPDNAHLKWTFDLAPRVTATGPA